MSARSMPRSQARIEAFDLARGFACVAMIVAHGYDAFVDAPHRATLGYAATRSVAKLALPLFLFLAGVGVALRMASASRRCEAAEEVRRALARRGLSLVLGGYALNVAYAALDGALGDLSTLLRVDVLHAIGLAILLLALTLSPAQTEATRTRWAALVAFALLAPTPWASAWGGHIDDPLAAPVFALFVDVPPFTRMPLVPLGAWAAAGAAMTPWLLRDGSRARSVFAAACTAGAAYGLMELWVDVSGAPLSRSHPAVWANAVDLGARAVAVTTAALCLEARALPLGAMRAPLLTLGRHSLTVYAIHLPFVYGRFGRPIRAIPDVDVAHASLAVALVLIGSLLAAAALERARRVPRRKAGLHSPP